MPPALTIDVSPTVLIGLSDPSRKYSSSPNRPGLIAANGTDGLKARTRAMRDAITPAPDGELTFEAYDGLQTGPDEMTPVGTFNPATAKQTVNAQGYAAVELQLAPTPWKPLPAGPPARSALDQFTWRGTSLRLGGRENG